MMRESLNLSRTEVVLPLNVYRIINAIFLVPGGAVLDKWGPRKPLVVSIAVAAALGLLFPFCNHLWHLVALQGLFAATKLLGGLGAMIMLVSRCFEVETEEEVVVGEKQGKGEEPQARGKKEGLGVSTATSIILSGYSAAGVIAPLIIGSLATRYGWRGASGFLGVLFAAIGVPLTVLYLKEPQRKGMSGYEKKNEENGVPEDGVGEQSTERERLLSDSMSFDSEKSLVQYRNAVLKGSSAALQDSTEDGSTIGRSAVRRSGSRQEVVPSASSSSISSAKNPSITIPSSSSTSSLSSSNVKDPLFTPPFFTMMLLVVLFAIPLHVVFEWFIDFLRTDIHYSLKAATLHYAAFNLVALVTKLFVGPLGDRYDKGMLIVISSAIMIVGWLCLFDFGFLSIGSAFAMTVTSNLNKIALFVPVCKSNQCPFLLSP